MSCSITSIATICITTPSKNEILKNIKLYEPSRTTLLERAESIKLIQVWMRQNLSNQHLYNGVFRELVSAVSTEGLIGCSTPHGCAQTVEQISCADRLDW